MKKSYFIFLLPALFAAVFPSCNCINKTERENSKAESELQALIDKWHPDAANSNLEAYIGAMADSAVFIGTDATERWTAPEFYTFCKPHFDSVTTWEFHPVKRFVFISEDGSTAWFDELLDRSWICAGVQEYFRKGMENGKPNNMSFLRRSRMT